MVGGRRHLHEQAGVAVAGAAHHHPEPDPVRHGGEPGQRHPTFENRPGRRVGDVAAAPVGG
jgi:hypothetical protein